MIFIPDICSVEIKYLEIMTVKQLETKLRKAQKVAANNGQFTVKHSNAHHDIDLLRGLIAKAKMIEAELKLLKL